MPPKKRASADSSNGVLNEDSNKKFKNDNISPESGIQRDSLNFQPLPQTESFKIISWNVNGLRAVLKNHPDALDKLVSVKKS